MIQEGLTNARKHAPHTPVAVRLSGAPGGGCGVEVRNPLPLQHWPPTPATAAASGWSGWPSGRRSAGAGSSTGRPRTSSCCGPGYRGRRDRARSTSSSSTTTRSYAPGLSLILGGAADIAIVGEAADGVDGVEVIRRTRPDVVLMDIRMPRLDGVEATGQVVALDDPPSVIVLTTFDADEYVVRALGAGASGFLLKDTPPEAIVDAVRKVAAGEPMLSPAITDVADPAADVARADGDRSAAAKQSLAGLTERELEVAVAVGRGRSNADIAAELFMSVATVKAHVSRLLIKLDADNRVQVAIRMHDAGLLEPLALSPLPALWRQHALAAQVRWLPCPRPHGYVEGDRRRRERDGRALARLLGHGQRQQ